MPASKKSTSTKTTGAKRARTPKTAAAVAAPEPTPEPVVVAAPEPVPEPVQQQVTATEEISLDEQFRLITQRLQEHRAMGASILADVRRLQKGVQRHVRESTRKNRRRAARTDGTKRPPSGFAKPALISDSLCQFLGRPSGTEMARTEVTKELTQYIKQHALQDSENKRRINCDSALKSLLNVSDSDEVTYFNLQRYMKIHFPNSGANAAATAAATASA
jgi:upstream activation factor subunit UAF30